MNEIRQQFAELVNQADDEIELARAALLIAAEEYPQLTPEPYLQRLDLFAEMVQDRLANESAAPVLLGEISKVLFEEERFRGNADAYYDPRNSFLNDVLDRHLGIPITLSVIYLEVGWRLGLPLEGVNFPGHFLIRYEGEALKLLVDPFQGGQIRFEDEAQDLLDRVYGGNVKLQDTYMRAASRRDILVRMLTNLKGIYLNARDDERALLCAERILLLRPDSPEEIRDYGMILARRGRVTDAIAQLESYLQNMPDAPDAVRVRMLIAELEREGRL
jgi:regulator of sirC expression with transglutaminase-like and TPR domain